MSTSTCTDRIHTVQVGPEKCIDVKDPEASAILIRDHLSRVRRQYFPRVHFTQRSSTCWFAAIMNALYSSALGGKLVKSLYFDWVIGIRAGLDLKRQNVLLYFRYAYDFDKNTIHYFKTDVVVRKLTRYSKTIFRNIGSKHGYFNERYIRKLYTFLGVPKERSAFIDCKKIQLEQVSEQISSKEPLVCFVLQKKNKIQDLKFEGYVFDACTITVSYSGHAHDVAGVTDTATGRKYVIDSESLDRFEFDWTELKNDIDSFESKSSKLHNHLFKNYGKYKIIKVLKIYYNTRVLKRLYNASKRVGKEWFDEMVQHRILEGSFKTIYIRGRWKSSLVDSLKPRIVT